MLRGCIVMGGRVMVVECEMVMPLPGNTLSMMIGEGMNNEEN